MYILMVQLLYNTLIRNFFFDIPSTFFLEVTCIYKIVHYFVLGSDSLWHILPGRCCTEISQSNNNGEVYEEFSSQDLACWKQNRWVFLLRRIFFWIFQCFYFCFLVCSVLLQQVLHRRTWLWRQAWKPIRSILGHLQHWFWCLWILWTTFFWYKQPLWSKKMARKVCLLLIPYYLLEYMDIDIFI